MCRYPAQEISYTKLLGQLQDKGNTDLVKYYIELYSGAFLIHPLEKYSAKSYLTRGLNVFTKQFPKALPVFITPDHFAAFSENPRKFLDTVANQ